MLLVIGVTLYFGYRILPLQEFGTLNTAAFWSAISLANIYFSFDTGYFETEDGPSPLLHMWSLGVEEQFYLVWPVALLLLMKLTAARSSHAIIGCIVGVIFLSFALSLEAVKVDPKPAFFLPQYRAWELGLGALLAFVPALQASKGIRTILAAVGFLLICGAAFFLRPIYVYPGVSALFPCVGAAFVILASPNTLIGSLLGWSPLSFLGRISYSMYLWHWPLIVFFRYHIDADTLSISQSMGIIAASIALSFASYKFVEEPFRRWQPQPKSFVLAALLLVLTSVVAAYAIDAFAQPTWMADQLIAQAQLQRAASVRRPTIGFFGDSSCLTGIYAPIIRRKLARQEIESFCMFGTVGAAGDAKALQLLGERQALPKVAIVMINPRQFSRRGIAREGTKILKKVVISSVKSNYAGKLRGDLAGRFKNAGEFVAALEGSGSIIDTRQLTNSRKPVSFEVPQEFSRYLEPLVAELSKLPPENIYLIISPVPDGIAIKGRADAAKQTAKLLGVPEANILATPAVEPAELFATSTHLNERGREKFSGEVADAIKRTLSGKL